MNFTLHCDNQPIFDQGFLEDIKAVAQSAMAYRFLQITQNNFGMSGEDRPETWPALTKDYADVYHGGSRIPKLELTGDLKASIEVDNASLDSSYVFTTNPYAWEHQFGNEETHLPARPFFPITVDGEVTEYTTQQCLEYMDGMVSRLLQ